MAKYAEDGSCTHISYGRRSPLSYDGYIGSGYGAATCVVAVASAEATVITTAAPDIGYAAFIAAFHKIHKILLVLIIQSNICMYIKTMMTVYFSHHCIDLSIWY